MADFNDLSRNFSRDIDRAIDEVLSPINLSGIARDLTERIVTRSRRGFGVPQNGGRQRRFRPLSPNYIEQRREARRDGILASTTSPARSNITFTGNLLDSIDWTTNEGEIYFAITNAQAAIAAAELHDNGRTFFFLTGADISRTTRTLTRQLRRELLEGPLFSS